MNSQALADVLEDTIRDCQKRILSTGRNQYADLEDEVQQFEKVSFLELFKMIEEEIEDTIVYAVMMRIRLQRTKEVFLKLEGRYNKSHGAAQSV